VIEKRRRGEGEKRRKGDFLFSLSRVYAKIKKACLFGDLNCTL
jgi:hypothetical protein